jgi:folate-binding protein YgfZ
MSGSTAVRLSGGDTLALLHRISTNALADLRPGQARATLFCDFRGRLLHRAVVAVTTDGAVWLLRDDAPGEPLATFVDKQVFRDDVRIDDRSEQLPVRRAARGTGLAVGTVVERDGAPTAVRIADDDLLAVGDAPGLPLADADETSAAGRVRAGRPAHGHEIVDAFTPFEVGLAHEVHLDKGCFTGQETLMRLVTYKGIRRQLARVSGPGPAPGVPREVRADGKPVGVLTTAATDGGEWIGLAVLKTEVCDPPRALELEGGGAVRPPEPLPVTRALGRP